MAPEGDSSLAAAALYQTARPARPMFSFFFLFTFFKEEYFASPERKINGLTKREAQSTIPTRAGPAIRKRQEGFQTSREENASPFSPQGSSGKAITVSALPDQHGG